jgi:general secretion pathway protein A
MARPLLDAAGLADAIAAAGPSTPDAWQSLLAAWQLPTDPADVAIAMRCAPTLAGNVYCLRGRATLDKLAAIGRPVLLQLHLGGHQAWARLQGVGALRVRLQLGDRSIEIPRVALQSAWSGDYVAVWRTTAPDSPLLADADAVRRFQTAHGLLVDGIAGPETRFAMTADAAGPHLDHGLD